MLSLTELEYLMAFSECKTLTEVADRFHISTPSVTRSMKNLEAAFGEQLFNRTKNRIELNDIGIVAVEAGRRVLDEAYKAICEVHEYSVRCQTITVRSCAPAPLWRLLPLLESRYPGMTVSSRICQNDEVIEDLENDVCDIAILPFDPKDSMNGKMLYTMKYMEEHLSLCVPKDHELAGYACVAAADINGFNFLLRSELGFWDAICRSKLPSSRFLVQEDEFEFKELVRNSSLPCFVTDVVSMDEDIYKERIAISITDPEVNVAFYLVSGSEGKCRELFL